MQKTILAFANGALSSGVGIVISLIYGNVLLGIALALIVFGIVGLILGIFWNMVVEWKFMPEKFRQEVYPQRFVDLSLDRMDAFGLLKGDCSLKMDMKFESKLRGDIELQFCKSELILFLSGTEKSVFAPCNDLRIKAMGITSLRDSEVLLARDLSNDILGNLQMGKTIPFTLKLRAYDGKGKRYHWTIHSSMNEA